MLIAGLVASTVAVGWFRYHLRTAEQELARGHNAAAARHLRECARLYSDQRDVLVLSARAARRAGAWDEAESLLARYSERYGDDEPVVFERLLLMATRGEVNRVAPQLLARVNAGGSDVWLVREAIVLGLLIQFRWSEAYHELNVWLTGEPDSTAALLLMGKLEEQRQGTEQALANYRHVLELDPEHDEARLRLASLLLANRRADEALPHLEILRRQLPENPEVAVQWAQALGLVGRTAESRAALDDCLLAHPHYPAALAERGALALLDGEEEAAVRYLGEAVRQEPGNLVNRNRYASALARCGRADEAAAARAAAEQVQADLERTTALIAGPLQKNRNDPAVLHELGTLALRARLVPEALRWFTEALRVEPNYLPTHRILIGVYRDLDNPALANRHRAIAQQLAASAPKQ